MFKNHSDNISKIIIHTTFWAGIMTQFNIKSTSNSYSKRKNKSSSCLRRDHKSALVKRCLGLIHDKYRYQFPQWHSHASNFVNNFFRKVFRYSFFRGKTKAGPKCPTGRTNCSTFGLRASSHRQKLFI